MKTKLIKFVFVGAIAIMAGINVFNAQKPAVLSDVAMENVEALADDTEQTERYKYVIYKEPGDPGYGQVKCVCVGENGELLCYDNEQN